MFRSRALFAVLATALAGGAACASGASAPVTGTGQDPVVSTCKVEGHDCTTVGAACEAKCWPEDAKKDAFVSFVVGGRALDSREVPFDPVAGGDRTLRYGCGLFTMTDGSQGLEVLYRKNLEGSAFADDALVRVDGFVGPGRYQAAVRYLASDVEQAAGKVYAKKPGCTVDLAAGAQGGVQGTLSCPDVPSKDGGAVTITGELGCPGTALEPILTRLP